MRVLKYKFTHAIAKRAKIGFDRNFAESISIWGFGLLAKTLWVSSCYLHPYGSCKVLKPGQAFSDKIAFSDLSVQRWQKSRLFGIFSEFSPFAALVVDYWTIQVSTFCAFLYESCDFFSRANTLEKTFILRLALTRRAKIRLNRDFPESMGIWGLEC